MTSVEKDETDVFIRPLKQNTVEIIYRCGPGFFLKFRRDSFFFPDVILLRVRDSFCFRHAAVKRTNRLKARNASRVSVVNPVIY